MFFVLKFLFKEKLWLIIALASVIVTTGLAIIQAFTMAKIVTVTTDMEGVVATLPDSEQVELTILQEVKKVYIIFQKEGNQEAISYLLGQQDHTLIAVIAVILLILFLLYHLFVYLKDFSADYLSLLVSSRIRKLIFNHLIDLPSSYYKENQSGDIISRSLNDISGIQYNIFAFFESLLFGPAITLSALICLFYINHEFTFILIGSGVGIGLTVHLVSNYLKTFVNRVQISLAKITGHIGQTLFGIDVIKIYNREKYEKDKFAHIVHHYLKVGRFERLFLNSNRPINEFFGAIVLIVVMFYGATLVWQEDLSKENIFQFLILLIYVAPHIQKMGKAILMKQQLDVYAERLENILNTPTEETVKTKAKNKNTLLNFSGKLEFKNIYFSYPNSNRPTLNNINLKVNPGEFIAIVGASGSGKSTLINTIPLLLKPSLGDILFDGIVHRNISLKEIRRNIGFVSQETILFPGTIRENILYGRLDASEEDIITSAKNANIHNFIVSREKGYETFVGERGAKLSQGQKQRLCIARALLKRPRILLLDEATSSLDTESERAVQRAIENLVHHQTTIAIAHRLSTILKADKILVMDEGEIIETGNHQSLLKKGGIYKKLYSLQFAN